VRIALFSYEYPPETAAGGIATCTHHTARMMAGCGHEVEVFAGSFVRSNRSTTEGVTVNRIRHDNHETFSVAAAPVFTERHAAARFDLMESPELLAEAAAAFNHAPEVARVVKIHSPNTLLHTSTHGQYHPPSFFDRVRLHLDALSQGEKPYWAGSGQPAPMTEHHRFIETMEREIACQADAVITPSVHLGQFISDSWQIPSDKLHHVPNVFMPSPAMLGIPTDSRTHRVTYIGRLEPLKGVFDLARAIPIIRKQFPSTRFRLIGESQYSDIFGDLGQYLRKTLLRRDMDVIEIPGPVPAEQIISSLNETEICVLPSILDNFPYACLEAMAAGRGVIGTVETGMAEMIEDGVSGKLVPKFSPQAISEAVCHWLAHPDLRQEAGIAARERVCNAYSPSVLGPMQEQAYTQALVRREQRLVNSSTAVK